MKAGRDTAARIPGATLVTYPGMGHDLPEPLWPDIVDQIRATAGAAVVGHDGAGGGASAGAG